MKLNTKPDWDPIKNDDKKREGILNRIITWCGNEGVQYEADQRHAEILIESLGITEAKPVSTPGIK